MVRLALLLILAIPQGASPQRNIVDPGVRVLEARMLPRAAATGDEFYLELLVLVEEGWELSPPDTLTYLNGARARGPVSVRPGEKAQGDGTRLLLTYPLQAMRPGELALPPLRARVRIDPGEGSLAPLEGRSVPKDSGPPGGHWVTLPLGKISLESVLPGQNEPLEPAGPLSPPSESEGPLFGLLVLGVLIALGSGAAAWITNRAGALAAATEDPGSSQPESRPPPISAGEARRRLSRLLAEIPLPSISPEAGLEEAFCLFRTILQAEAEGVNEASTSAEILLGLQASGWGDTSVLSPILDGGDRNRFGSSDLSEEQILDGLHGIRGWLEGSNG